MVKSRPLPPIDDAEVQYVKPDKLRFDSHNPRLIEFLEENKKPSQDELLQVLWDEMAVDELVMSIAKSGYMPYEPLLVAKEGGDLVVIEGNRRLAAVLLLLNLELRSKVKAVDLPKPSATAAKTLVALPVIYTDRRSAWKYLGVKHINGPKKWDSYAKAQYIASVADSHKVPLEEIAVQIGDKHHTVQRLYRALKVIEQAEDAKVFDRANRSKRHFSFSHLYTGLDYENIARFIGLKEESLESDRPVEKKCIPQLGELCKWLYGDRSSNQSPLIDLQEPHLRQLDAIVGSKRALAAIRRGAPLEFAYEDSFDEQVIVERSLYEVKQAILPLRRVLTRGYTPRPGEVSPALAEIQMLLGSLRSIRVGARQHRQPCR